MRTVADIKKSFIADLKEARDFVSLEEIYKKYLGVKKGELTLVLRSLKDLSPQKRKKIGNEANILKNYIARELQKKRNNLRHIQQQEMHKDRPLDFTAPGQKPEKGHIHPLTRVIQDLEDIFRRMGFEIAAGPEIETEFYNFDALNIPSEHPARDLWDTFWLRQNEGKSKNVKGKNNEKLLLRTHTSPVQIRYMETHEPPFRIIVPGRVFRHEATDASHHFNFYQVEGLMVGEDVSVANFKAVIHQFFREFFRKDVRIRLRPSYFPFVEPGFEVDMSCIFCISNGFRGAPRHARGCSVCHGTSWLEMMGAGMVHPNVFKAVKYNPKFVQGFAFGMGIDRLAMMRYKIGDVRLFYSGDMRFLKQF